MQLIAVLREFRGSAHLLAVRAEALDARTAHYLHRPGDMAMFGWGEDETPEVTDSDRSKLQAALHLTDKLVVPAYSVLDESGQRTLIAGLEAVGKALGRS